MSIAVNEKSTILIVDDTPANLGSLFDFLTDSGFSVSIARNGEKAIERAEYAMPDLILLDILMPGIDGFETCRRLKANELTKDIPVIFMTALTETVDKVKGLSLGAVDYITKPLQHEEVLARVTVHLSLRNLTKRLTQQNVRLEEEIQERKRAESIVNQQTRVLEMIASGASLSEVLDSLARMIEEHSSDVLCSILILDRNGINLWHGAAPSLPKTYTSAVDGIAIGPNVGSCGTAAYFGKPIIVEDIANDPLWKDGRELALSHELRACWSSPILLKNGTVLGTFAMYYHEPKSPNSQDLQLLSIATHIAGIAIERKRAEEEREQAFCALQQSEARFRRLVESDIIGIIFADLNGNISDANDAFLKMVGYERSELLSGKLRWDEMTPPEHRHLDEKAIAEFINCGIYSPFEKEFIRKDGSRIPVMVGGALLEESSQNTVGFVLNLTDRKIAEQKIRQQAALLDITTDAIFVRDLDNQIRFWNKGAERLYGWTAEEALGKNTNQLLYRLETLSQLENNQASLAEYGSWHSELYQVTKEGKEIIVASRWTLVRDDDGQPISILIVNTDITEKKLLEAQVLRTQRMESIGTLAGGIAHDLNNALTPMMMVIQLLEAKLRDEQSQQWLSILETNVKRSADLVKQVLSFSRGVAGKHSPLEVGCLIQEIEKMVKQTFSRAIEIRTDIPTRNLWTICGDATQLHQVLMNLCINARDAMPAGGILEISAKNLWIDENYVRMNIDAKVGPYVVISVSDTGTGIKSEVIERIFEPFFTTKEVGKGTGLGLSTVVGIIKSHGGFVKVLSEVGKGTEFKVYLPVTQTVALENPYDEGHKLPKGHGELILVIDDEDSIREITKTSLEAYDYRVLTARDGIEAVAVYAQHKDEISLALVDMMMPCMDGMTTIRTLQKINPQVKIIAVSGLVSNLKAIEHLGDNVKTFLSKPYTSNELLENLQLVLSVN